MELIEAGTDLPEGSNCFSRLAWFGKLPVGSIDACTFPCSYLYLNENTDTTRCRRRCILGCSAIRSDERGDFDSDHYCAKHADELKAQPDFSSEASEVPGILR